MERLIRYLEFVYLLLINLPYLGKPSADKMEFMLSTYRQAFGQDLAYLDKLFYYLYGNRLIFIHEIRGQKAGFVLFRMTSLSELHCPAFAFEKSFQKKGLVIKFIPYCFKYWKEKGFKTMSANIANDNLLSIRLFRIHGFKLMNSGRDRGYYLKLLSLTTLILCQVEGSV